VDRLVLGGKDTHRGSASHGGHRGGLKLCSPKKGANAISCVFYLDQQSQLRRAVNITFSYEQTVKPGALLSRRKIWQQKTNLPSVMKALKNTDSLNNRSKSFFRLQERPESDVNCMILNLLLSIVANIPGTYQ
jgi:hypothetical protein